MLSKPILTEAAVLALQLENEGLKLQLATSGPLHDLVDAATPIRVYSDDEKGYPEGMMPETVVAGNAPIQNQHTWSRDMIGVIEDVHYTTNFTPDEEHSKRIRGLADDIAPFVQSHMSFFRNTVRPEVQAMEEALQRFVSQVSAPPAQSEFRVDRFKLPELLLDETFLNMGLLATDNAGEHEYLDRPSSSIQFSIPADLKVFADAVCNVGNKRVSDLVSTWRANAMHDVIERVFLANFASQYGEFPVLTTNRYGETSQGNSLDDYQFYGFRFRDMDGLEYLDVALAYFLIAQHLLNNPAAYESKVSSLEYRSILQSHVGRAGHYVNHLMKKVKSATASNTLVLMYQAPLKMVLINDALFSDFVGKGGSMEVILGSLVKGSNIMDAGLLLQKKDDCLQAWSFYIQMSETKAKDSLLANFVSYARDFMCSSMQDPSGLEKEYLDGNPGHKEKVMAMVEEHLRQKALESLRDIPEFALQAVAGYRFYYTEAYRFLKAMHDANTANPNIDAGEAAGLAELDYLVRYLCGMVNAVKVCA